MVQNLSQEELQNLRHLINAHETASQKLSTYAQQSSDQEIKQMFQQSAQNAKNTKQKLMTFLQ